jgi:hypothetical protein
MTVGACWCADGRHFLVHSGILAVSLGVRSDSLPARFRKCGFEVDPGYISSAFDYPQSVSLPDPQRWCRRYHRSGLFDCRTTVREAKQLFAPPAAAKTRSPPGGDPFAQSEEPPPRLFPPGSPGEAEALRVLARAQGDDEWKAEFLETAVADWVSTFGKVGAVGVERFLARALSDDLGPIPDQTRANLAALLSLLPTSPGPDGASLPFAEYLALMLRFGPMGRLRQSIEALTVAGPARGGDPFGGFAPWFRPLFGDDEAKEKVKAARDGTWLVRLSPTANEFALHWYASEAFPVVSCRIPYDGLAPASAVYVAAWENDAPESAGSWEQLIGDVLGLQLADGFESAEPSQPGSGGC